MAGTNLASGASPAGGPGAAALHEQWLEPGALGELQRRKLAAMLRDVLGANAFYRRKYAGLITLPESADQLRLEDLPFTTRAELEADQAEHPPFGTNLTYHLHRYCRFHQTSGSTTGRSMRWLDTAESWDWFKACWSVIYDAAAVRGDDRFLFPFSFGPFVGFWAAFESAVALGRLSLPAGGLSTSARLRMIVDNGVTVICCTPTYALRMAEVAAADGVDLRASAVRALIVAGEPGGSVPEVRARIEAAWGARVFDHNGMTEIGALGFECMERPGQGLHLIESECIPEVIDPDTTRPVPEGGAGELVLTNLGRWGSPLIRYRTGDHVRLTRGRCDCGRWFARLEGGILGRIDDMVIVRGNNVFPPAVEAVIRRFAEVVEFRVTVFREGALSRVKIELEPTAEAAADASLAPRVAQALQQTLSFRADVATVPAGSLPRFEMKARRFVKA